MCIRDSGDPPPGAGAKSPLHREAWITQECAPAVTGSGRRRMGCGDGVWHGGHRPCLPHPIKDLRTKGHRGV
eukprot:10674603-Prorocentrum_lima.AAC.1